MTQHMWRKLIVSNEWYPKVSQTNLEIADLDPPISNESYILLCLRFLLCLLNLVFLYTDPILEKLLKLKKKIFVKNLIVNYISNVTILANRLIIITFNINKNKIN